MKISIVNAFLLLLVNLCLAQVPPIIFNRVSTPEGTDFGLVTGITQDARGYMWLATRIGVYRYDGYNLVSYSDKSLDLSPFGDLQIECICIDHHGFIWFGGNSTKIRRLDPATGILRDYPFTAGNQTTPTGLRVSAVLEDHEGNIWVGTHAGLNRLDPKTGKYIHYEYNPYDPHSLSNDQV